MSTFTTRSISCDRSSRATYSSSLTSTRPSTRGFLRSTVGSWSTTKRRTSFWETPREELLRWIVCVCVYEFECEWVWKKEIYHAIFFFLFSIVTRLFVLMVCTWPSLRGSPREPSFASSYIARTSSTKDSKLLQLAVVLSSHKSKTY